MRRGQVEQANALSSRIGSAITAFNSGRLKSENNSLGAHDMWSAVRDITGKRRSTATLSCVDANNLNAHYAKVSTDPNYLEPHLKSSCHYPTAWPTEMLVFHALDTLKATAAGPDQLPSWFIKLAAPIISGPVAHIFALSLQHSTVPQQWKTAAITPIPKIPLPISCADFRPISLTPILCRVLERLVLRSYIYPVLSSSSTQINTDIRDQFAFRPTGSTSAALISILQSISEALELHPYVHVISCDFSKAFDTVRHSTLLDKLSQIPFPDSIYNWLVCFFSGRQHYTNFQGKTSPTASINAGVVQGSAVGPAAFLVCASDLHPVTPGNKCCKYADDTYLIIPSPNTASISTELSNLTSWAKQNNLLLNPTKSYEIIFKKPRSRVADPPPTPCITRVTSLKVLGITLQDNLTMHEHVSNLVSKASQSLYALKIIKSNGLAARLLNTVTQATLLSQLTYASVAWWGFTSAEDRVRLQSVLNRAHRWGFFSSPSPPNLQETCSKYDSNLFTKTIQNSDHVLHSLLPPLRPTHYNLRPRVHQYSLPSNSSLLQRNFIGRMLFKDVF